MNTTPITNESPSPSTSTITTPGAGSEQPSRYSLLSSGPITDKTYAVAHFMVDQLDFSHWQTPIHIARMYGDSKGSRKIHLPPPNSSNELKQEIRQNIQKSRRNYPFHVEDASKKNVFNAYYEADQSNRFDPSSSYKYVILKSFENTFRVIPCDDWYTFKREQTNPTLSLEEAEKIMKERMKGERRESNNNNSAVEAAPQKPNKLLSLIKDEPQKEVQNARLDFNPTGDIDADDDDGLGSSFKTIKKRKEKGEDMDFDDEFDDDNKEDRFHKNTEFEVGQLSADSKDLKKLMREKSSERFDDDLSDEEEKEFAGVEDLLEKKIKDTKTGEKRANDGQTPTASKKAKSDPSAANIKNPPTEKEVEKQIREFLSVQGKVQLTKVLAKFKDVISVISKESFREILKRLVEAKQENKITYLYLKDDQYREFR